MLTLNAGKHPGRLDTTEEKNRSEVIVLKQTFKICFGHQNESNNWCVSSYQFHLETVCCFDSL